MARVTGEDRKRALGMLQVSISNSHRTAIWMPPFNNQEMPADSNHQGRPRLGQRRVTTQRQDRYTVYLQLPGLHQLIKVE